MLGMLRAVVARVKSTMAVVLGILINRAIYDTVSVNALRENVDALILGAVLVKRIFIKYLQRRTALTKDGHRLRCETLP